MKYIGSRYVPKFMGTYDATQIYEALCVVDNGLGTSYISQKIVPAGTPLTNTTYWAIYGSPSGAIIHLQDQIDTINKHLPTPQLFGAIGDGTNDDTQAIIDALASSDGLLYFPAGHYKITSSISIPDNYIIMGDFKKSVIDAYGCDAFIINPTWGCHISDLRFVEYDSLGNPGSRAHKAIICNGSAPSDSVNYCIFKNLNIEGFNVGIDLRYTWNGIIDSCKITLTNICVQIFGQSVNNSISNSELTAFYNNDAIGEDSGSASILSITDGSYSPEGLSVTNSMLTSGNWGVALLGNFLAFELTNSYVDLIKHRGLHLNGTSHIISNNWIQCDGDFGINIANKASATNVDIIIDSNTIKMSDASGRGIQVGYYNNNVTVKGNIIDCYATGIYSDTYNTNNIIEGNIINHLASTTASSIYVGGKNNIIANNSSNTNGLPVQFVNNENTSIGNLDRIFNTSSLNDIPTGGTWNAGDILLFKTITSGYIGAICTSSGTPGTWKYFGAIAP